MKTLKKKTFKTSRLITPIIIVILFILLYFINTLQGIREAEAAAPSKSYITVKYDRSNWHTRWGRHPKGCDIRHRMLIEKSIITATVRNCKVIAGKWQGFYSLRTTTSPSGIDIDHVVSLKDAYESGGYRWPKSKKKRFASDLDNLVISISGVNRAKGAKTPVQFNPTYNKCWYATRYRDIKNRWKLTITPAQYNAIRILQKYC